ncbi:hypothetical protein M3G00_08060 [Brevibacterium casei]|uniref:hypothetical protein n=1 Tax=Brevibacterium casei TaxID=33889 RepID=UPI00223B90DE|nr:hypothetical protein [Brevibacterium casei]MCT1446161.1 hypothetical protein [Brevibacterium casei]MCT2182890.1 hypothetical protein [Brevibacterium casei]
MNRAATCATIAAALILSGCAGNRPGDEAAPTPTQATVEQFASVVARNEQPIRSIAEDRSDCYLDIILRDRETLAQSCIDAAAEGRFALIVIKDEFGELGDPPAEIDELVQRLTRGGQHMADTPELDVRANCGDAQSDECAETVASVMESLKQAIVPELDAWKPYL